MHLKMIYKYSVDRTLQKLIRYIVTVFLCFITFVLLLISIFAWKFIRQGRMAVDECLYGGIEQAGLLEVEVTDIEDYEIVNSFVQEVIRMEEINGIGDGGIYGRDIEGIEELWEEQERVQKKSDEYLWVYNTNVEAFNICNIKLQEGDSLLPPAAAASPGRKTTLTYTATEKFSGGRETLKSCPLRADPSPGRAACRRCTKKERPCTGALRM